MSTKSRAESKMGWSMQWHPSTYFGLGLGTCTDGLADLGCSFNGCAQDLDGMWEWPGRSYHVPADVKSRAGSKPWRVTFGHSY